MNIENIIFPQREGLENKWWHRLIQVSLYTSSFAILCIGLFISISTYQYNEEIVCGYSIPKITYEKLNLFKEFDIISGANSIYELEDGSYIINGDSATRVDALNYIADKCKQEKQQKQKELIKELIVDILLVLIITISWFIITESIIYRIIIYVIYGTKKSL